MKSSKSAILCLLFATAVTQAQAAERSADTLELLHATGVTQQIAALQALVTESSLGNATRCGSKPPSTHIPSFSAESVIHDTLQNFDHIEAPEMNLIVKWFQSPLAQRIHEAEQRDLDPLGVSRYIPFLRENPTRFEMTQRIVRNTRTMDFVITIGSEVEYAGLLHSGCIAKAQPSTPPGSINPEQALADTNRGDNTLTALLMAEDITIDLAYLLRHLTDSEIKQYAEFTESTAAQSFYKSLITAIEKSVMLASDRIQPDRTHSALDF